MTLIVHCTVATATARTRSNDLHGEITPGQNSVVESESKTPKRRQSKESVIEVMGREKIKPF